VAGVCRILALVVLAAVGSGCDLVDPDADDDRTPPAPVGDLGVRSVHEGTVTIGWTAPGDDGSQGRASDYDIRLSYEPITAATWDEATRLAAPKPEKAGTGQSLTLSYRDGAFLALRSADEIPNWSGSSNVIRITDPPLDRVMPSWAIVPRGGFRQGDGLSPCGTWERNVTLSRDFRLARHEITNAQYLAAVQWAFDAGLVRATTTTVFDNLDGSSVELLGLENGSEIGFNYGAFTLRDIGYGPDNADHPVKAVTWYGAAAFCDWLSIMEGRPRAYDHRTWSCGGGHPYEARGYRLPTEAEWEYAAQYDDERCYPWGDSAPNRFCANFGNEVGWTVPVGSFPGAPVILGASLYDLAGNVREWCEDWYRCPGDQDPTPLVDPTGPATGTQRVARGGGWATGGSGISCSAREGRPPGDAFGTVGFRVVRPVR
jgi:formylglycine-generating enzyme required for sulfatase activity